MDDGIRARLDLISRTRLNTISCIFCGKTPTTKEHIFPEWTHQYLGPREAKNARMLVSAQHPDRTDLITDLRMSGPLRDWQIKCVCGGGSRSCNNGWMRQIEDDVRPILLPMILGQKVFLSSSDQRSVATWAVLKSMVIHHPYVRPKNRKAFYRKRMPLAEWSVWVGHYDREHQTPQFVSRPFVIGPRHAEGKPAVPNCHASTQFLNKLVVHVVNCTQLDFPHRWQFTHQSGAPLDGAIIRIWPLRDSAVEWPPKGLSATDVDGIANKLFRAIQRELIAHRLPSGNSLGRQRSR